MQQAWQIAAAMAFPLILLGVVIWLGHVEDTLDRDVRRARRRPDPPPILAIPVRSAAPGHQVRPEPVEQVVVVPAQTSEAALSPTLSFGGSTNL